MYTKHMTLKITARQLETAARRFFATCAAAHLRGNVAHRLIFLFKANANASTIAVYGLFMFLSRFLGCIGASSFASVSSKLYIFYFILFTI